MAHSIFISYSDKDKALADRFLQALEGRGCKCWIAPRDIRPGASYAESILVAIENADSLVLIFTGHSSVSPHVLREVEQAVRLRKSIMPVRCDDAPVSKALDYLLSTVQWISALPKPADTTIDHAAAQIAVAVSSPDQAVQPVPAVSLPVVKPINLPGIGKIAVTVLATIGAAVIAVYAWRGMHAPLSRAGGRENILAAQNGGQVLVSSGANWNGTIDGRVDQIYWFAPSDEAVFGFKNGGAATFSHFQAFIPDSDSHNLRQFEVLVGNDSPTGQFKSIGKFTAKNSRTGANDGYQQFDFPPVTAKFVKVRLLSDYDQNDQRIALYEFRLLGAVTKSGSDGATPGATVTAHGINLLSPENGGAVAFAPNEAWAQTIDDREDQVFWFEPHEEAVYRFRNELPATFATFSLLIPDNDEHNLKEFELLAGNVSPSGQFRSLGKFTAHNARIGAKGYQEFPLPRTTAKYLKVRLLAPFSTTDTRIFLYEFRLYGEPAN